MPDVQLLWCLDRDISVWLLVAHKKRRAAYCLHANSVGLFLLVVLHAKDEVHVPLINSDIVNSSLVIVH